MRENSGKGESHTGSIDPTLKEREEAKGRSGQAMLKPKEPPKPIGHSAEAIKKEKERRSRADH